MAVHFTQSSKFRDFNIGSVNTEEEAFLALTKFCLGDSKTFACPLCGAMGDHYLRAERKQWRCKECHSCFSPTSRTALHKRKLPCLKLVRAIVLYANAHNGLSANQLAGALGVTTKTAWLLLSKIREVFVLTWDTTPMEGDLQADGGHFCGKPRRANHRNRTESVAVNAKLKGRKAAIDPSIKRSSIEPWNRKKLENRRVVLAIRQLHSDGGKGAQRTIVAVLRAEAASKVVPFIKETVIAGARISTDSGGAFMPLAADFDLHMVNHSKEYSTPAGVNNNQAESYMSRLRRGEFGVFRGMRRRYFLDYCVEMAWREDYRRSTIGEHMQDIFSRIRRCGPSPSFAGYCQGTRRLAEWTHCPRLRTANDPG